MSAAPLLDQTRRAIEDLDGSWEIPCERPSRANLIYSNGRKAHGVLPNCGGENPADWVLWSACDCPPAYHLHCTPCRDIVLGYIAIRCPGCLVEWTPGRLAYRLIAPLNRSRP